MHKEVHFVVKLWWHIRPEDQLYTVAGMSKQCRQMTCYETVCWIVTILSIMSMTSTAMLVTDQ